MAQLREFIRYHGLIYDEVNDAPVIEVLRRQKEKHGQREPAEERIGNARRNNGSRY